MFMTGIYKAVLGMFWKDYNQSAVCTQCFHQIKIRGK